jgi:hypothetical protein
VAQVVLDRPCILAVVRQLVPAAMPQHVAGNEEREFRGTKAATMVRLAFAEKRLLVSRLQSRPARAGLRPLPGNATGRGALNT